MQPGLQQRRHVQSLLETWFFMIVQIVHTHPSQDDHRSSMPDSKATGEVDIAAVSSAPAAEISYNSIDSIGSTRIVQARQYIWHRMHYRCGRSQHFVHISSFI